jgi:hypothetical protein
VDPPWPPTDDYDQREDPAVSGTSCGSDRLIAELRSELDEANDILRRFDASAAHSPPARPRPPRY